MDEGSRRVAKRGIRGGRCGGGCLDEGGPMDEIGLAEKFPPETRGGEIANLDRGIKAVKSGSGGRDLEIGIRAGLRQTEPENRTKPGLFCLHPALIQHLEDCIRKHRRSLID